MNWGPANWVVAGIVGAAVSIACFGGLWIGLRQAMRAPRRRARLAVGQMGRIVLCAVVFWVLSRNGIGAMLSALAAFWLVRSQMIRSLGVISDGR